MTTSTLIARAILAFALLALTATAANAQSRLFQVEIINGFEREVSLEAVAGNHNYEGQQRKMAIPKGGSEVITLAFNNRSSIGWHDGHVNLKFNDESTMGEGHIQILFDRGGRIYEVTLVRAAGETSIAARSDTDWFSESTDKKKVGKMNVTFSGPTKWTEAKSASYAGSTHYYKIELSSLVTPVLENVDLIFDYEDGPSSVRVLESSTAQQEKTYARVVKSEWSVSATIEASFAGTSGSATASAGGSSESTEAGKAAQDTASSKEKVVTLAAGQMRFTLIRGDIVKNENGEYRFRPKGRYSSSIVTKTRAELEDLVGYFSVAPAAKAAGLILEEFHGEFMKVVGCN